MENVKVYALTDCNDYIIAIEGGCTFRNIANLENWTVIDEGSGQRFTYCQTLYMPLPLMTDGGAYRYKLVDGKPVACAQEEIAWQEESCRPSTSPTLENRVEILETDSQELREALELILSGVSQ